MAVDWLTQRGKYDWNENDNLLHKVRVGRRHVMSQLCSDNQFPLEDLLPKHEVEIQREIDGTWKELTDVEPLFLRNERNLNPKRIGRMRAAHEEFRKKMLVGDLDIRDAVALMG